MSKADESGTAQPSGPEAQQRVQQRVQQAVSKQECLSCMRDLLALPSAQLCNVFDGEDLIASACVSTWRQAICKLPDLKLWLLLVRHLRASGALLPTPQLLSAVQKLQKHADITKLAGKVVRDLRR